MKAVDGASGALTQTDHTILDGSCARAVVVDPSGHNVYIGMARFSGSLGEIQGFSISAGGTLTELPGSPFLVNGTPSALAIHPTGKYLYASSDSGVLLIDRDTATGGLAERGAFNTPKNGLALNPDGTFLLATESQSNEVSQFHVDPATGNLEAIDFRPSASAPFGVAADPLGSFFAVTERLDPNTLAGGVSTFLLDSATHQVNKISGSPFIAGHGTTAVAFDPSGTHIYAANRQDATVSAFVIDRKAGSLTPVSGSHIGTGDFPDALVVVNPH